MKNLGRIVFGFVVAVCFSSAVFGATYTVTKIADTNDGTCDADCSLREAVVAANGTADNDTIVFSSLFNTAQTITLSGTEIVFANNGSLTIIGTGANKLTISGNNASRIFASGANVVVNINNLRFTGGNGAGAVNTGRGGAIYNVGGTMVIYNSILTGNSAANGGALNNAASTAPAVPANLTLINCSVSNNSATSSGSAMQNFSTSTIHLRNTSVTNNTTSATGIAGAIQGNGVVTITNSTFSGNTAPAGTGGGVYFNGTSLIMTNTTIVNNSSGIGGGGLHRTGTTGLNIRNTIIAGNNGAAATPDAFGPVNSEGNNIIGNVGTSTGWVMSDLQNVNPILSPLGFYGGIGFSHAPLTTSPALNAGQNCVIDLTCAANNPPVAITTDQRGASRSNVDIGAFEDSTAYRAVLPTATQNQAYSTVLSPNVGSFTFTNTGGSPPAGVSVNTGGVIASVSGTPFAGGVFDFSVTISNGMNSAVVNYRLYVAPFATASVGGRITNTFGFGKIYVTLIDANGNVRHALVSPFGYYQFNGVNVGEVYQVIVKSKVYTFNNNPRYVLVNDAIGNLDFVALP